MSAIPLRTDLAGRLMTVQNNYVLGMGLLRDSQVVVP
jgi:hypothetical protein